MKKVQKTIGKHLKVRGWHENSPVDIAKSIIIEGAELMEIFQWDNPHRKDVIKNSRKMEEIKNEVADLFIYCFGMAVSLDFDAEEAVIKKLNHVGRKYPAKIMKLGGGEYLKIKKDYRKRRKK